MTSSALSTPRIQSPIQRHVQTRGQMQMHSPSSSQEYQTVLRRPTTTKQWDQVEMATQTDAVKNAPPPPPVQPAINKLTKQQARQREQEQMIEELNKQTVLQINNPKTIGVFNKDGSVSCQICYTSNRLETIHSVLKHTQCPLHRTSVELFTAREVIKELQAKLNLKQSPIVLPKFQSGQDFNQPVQLNQTAFTTKNRSIRQQVNQDVQVINTEAAHVDDYYITQAQRPILNLKEHTKTYSKPWIQNQMLKPIFETKNEDEAVDLMLRILIEESTGNTKHLNSFQSKNNRLNYQRLCNLFRKNKQITFQQIEEKYLWSDVQFNKVRRPLYSAFLAALEFPETVMQQARKYQDQVRQFKLNKQKKHKYWKHEQLLSVWQNYYCSHPYLRMMFIIALTVGLRQEDLFQLPLAEFESAISENHRSVLKLREGKIRSSDNTFLRYYYIADGIAERLRTELELLKNIVNQAGKNQLFLFGPHLQQTTIIAHLRYQIKLLKLNREKYGIEATAEMLQDYICTHNFRTTCSNKLAEIMPKHERDEFIGWKTTQNASIYYDRELEANTYQKVAEKIEPHLAIPSFKTPDVLTAGQKEINKRMTKYIKDNLNFGEQIDMQYIDNRNILKKLDKERKKKQKQGKTKVDKATKKRVAKAKLKKAEQVKKASVNQRAD